MGRLFKAVFVADLVGDIKLEADEMCRRAIVVKDRRHDQVVPERRAVLAVITDAHLDMLALTDGLAQLGDGPLGGMLAL